MSVMSKTFLSSSQISGLCRDLIIRGMGHSNVLRGSSELLLITKTVLFIVLA